MALNVTIKLKALDGISGPTGTAREGVSKLELQTAKLATGLKVLGGVQSDVEKFRKLKLRSKQTSQELERSQAEVDRLARELNKMGPPTEKTIRDFEQAKNKTRALARAQKEETQQLEQLRRRLGDAGISTRNLASDNRKLKTSMHELNEQYELNARLVKRSQAASEQLQKRTALSGNISFIGTSTQQVSTRLNTELFNLRQAAVSVEESMADIAKVADIDAPGLRKLQQDLTELTTQKDIPLTIEELAEIAAAAAQANVPTDQLAEFTENVAKAATAFDILPQAAGTNFAKIRNILQLSIEDTILLGDAINTLSNKDAAEAAEILDGVRRTAAGAKAFGLNPQETAALQSSLVALGIRTETASRGINNMFGTLSTVGEKGPKVKNALAEIGLTASELQDNIDQDAPAALLDFFTRVRSLGRVERASVLTNIFGQGFQDELGTLAGGVGTLERALSNVSNELDFAGSMHEEFAKRAATSANLDRKFQNSLTAMKVTLGTTLLPTMNALVVKATEIIGSFDRWAKKHPALAKGLLTITLGVAGVLTVLAPLLTLTASVIGSYALLKFAATQAGISLLLNRKAIIATALSMKRFAVTAIPSAILGLRTLAVQSIPAAIVSFRSFAASAISTAIAGLRSLAAGAIPAVLTGLRLVGAAMLTNPIGLIATGIAVAAFLIIKNWKPIGAFFGKLWTGIKGAAASAWTTLKTLFKWSPLGPVTSAFSGIAGAISNPIKTARGAASAIWSGMKTVFSWSPVGLAARAFSGLRKMVGGHVSAARNLAGRAWQGLKGIFSWSPNKLVAGSWAGLPGSFKGIMGSLLSVVSNAMKRVLTLFKGPFEALQKLGQGIKKLIGIGGKTATAGLAAAGLSATPALADDTFSPPSLSAPDVPAIHGTIGYDVEAFAPPSLEPVSLPVELETTDETDDISDLDDSEKSNIKIDLIGSPSYEGAPPPNEGGDNRPPPPAAGASTTNTYTFYIYGASGQTAEEIAKEVERLSKAKADGSLFDAE